ncbi:AraC family transcriptional regulator [Dickeya dadantii]|uniref:AraC family transcriptional regulator n=1 Tax=Dickeya dadantii TaxID=204038 RepID=UPI001CF3BA07|nr:AraC family transcriptional regulator [Dickeya dadantii]MCA7011615.1 AraC family transcriptional regulator [Dickeya dadantii]
MAIDLLTEVLRSTGLSARKLALSELRPGQALQFPCERSVGLHVVMRGPIYLHTTGRPEPQVLEQGDIAVMARGVPHILSLSPTLAGQRQEYLDIRQPRDVPEYHDKTHVFSGAYQFWHAPLHPLFTEMSDWYILRSADIPDLGALAMTSTLLVEELRGIEPGSRIITHGLMDVVFAYIMRQLIARRATTQAGWCQGASDPLVRQVMTLMQEDIAHPWTLDELARRVGMSRTALATRFRAATGETPINYLRTLRMQHAMQLLADTRQSLDAVAAAVGYQDAFGFSRVFKRITGISPRAFRLQDAAERESPRRFAVD